MPNLPFGSYTLPIFLYEDFSYTISNAGPVDTVKRSSGLTASLFTSTSSNLTFAGNGSSLTAGSTESFSYTVLDLSGNPTITSSNTVPVGTGRFTDLSGNGVGGSAYTFYKSEPISTIRLKAPFALSTAVSSVPSLPPGLKFYVSGSNLDISGTPLTTLPTSNYLIIGKDAATGSKIVTTSNTYSVSNERINYTLSGAPIVTMNVGVNISPRQLTAAFPPYPSGGTLKYVWDTLPRGIVVLDVTGSNRTISNTYGFPTTDASHAFTMEGAPTLAAAYQYANAGVSSATYRIEGTRTSPLPAITSNFFMTFAFNETVLFDQSAIPTVYSGVPIDASANFFRAQTYFATGSGTAISNIFSPDLRADLSLTFVPNSSRAFLSGTPSLGAGSANYTIRAINSNGIIQQYVTPITVQDDFITFVSPTPAIDTCYNFIVSRPINVPKNGYYPYPIQFKAQAASGLPVTLSAPALAGTGLSLDSNGFLGGFPDTPTPLTTLTVTATAAGSPATATRNTKFAVLNDVFTFGNVLASNFNFIQNKAIVPFQIPVTTLSERPITNFAQNQLPFGLDISPAGVVSGTPLSSDVSGTIEIVPTTGYSSGSAFYNYTKIPESVLLIVSPSAYSYQSGNSIGNINIVGVAFSGTTVSNYDLSINPTYGMTINSTNGIVSGTWSDSIPPNDLLPSSSNFTVNAQAGAFFASLPAVLTADPVVSNISVFAAAGDISGGSGTGAFLYKNARANSSSAFPIGFSTSGFSDIRFKTNNPATNLLVATTTGGGDSIGVLLRGTTLAGLTTILIEPDGDSAPSWSKIVNKTGTNTWWIGGSLHIGGAETAVLLRSEDDALTWSPYPIVLSNSSLQKIFTRDSNGQGMAYSVVNDPYLRGGIALAYKDGVLLAGGLSNGTDGPVMIRSANDGSNWSNVTNGFGQECANYNLDVSSMWIVTGSDYYRSIDYASFGGSQPPFTVPSTTIKYSTDQGSNWSNTSGGFNVFGYEVVYGNNVWIASGVQARSSGDGDRSYFIPQLRYSANGSNWSVADLSTNSLFDPSNFTAMVAPLRIGSMNFDGDFWNVLVSGGTGSSASPTLYRHDASSSLATGWIATPLNLIEQIPNGLPNVNDDLRYLSLTSPSSMYTGEPPIRINLEFNTFSPGGPTITGPADRFFLQYQYIPIEPIQLTATGPGFSYFFLETADLPPGLTFNPLTNQITGTPARIGQDVTTVYAKNSIGVSSTQLSFNTIIPRVVRQQDGAGAYTSLLRQYTNVLGAQNARDNRVLPNQTLGEFMAPDAPDVITQVIDPKCRNPNC